MGHTSNERIERKNMMIDQGLDKPLLEVAKAFPMFRFSEPDIVDSRELAVEANTGNINVKVFIATKNIQIELRARTKEQKLWLHEHFNRLGASTSLRRDNVFLPEEWKGTKNMAFNCNEAIKRVELLLEIIHTDSRNELSSEAMQLL